MSVSLVKPSDEISLECSVRESSTNFHFEGKCESCDAHRMSRLTLGGVEDRYYSGRLTQTQYEAYTWAFDYLSPYRNNPARPFNPAVRRIARALFRFRERDVPAVIQD